MLTYSSCFVLNNVEKSSDFITFLLISTLTTQEVFLEMETMFDKKIRDKVFDIVSIDSGNQFLFLSDEIGAVTVYNQLGDLIDTFVHLGSTGFGMKYQRGANYIVKFSCEGVVYEEIIVK